MKIKTGIENLLASVSQHPLLEVSEWSCNPPVDAALFQQFENRYGFACTGEIKECYSEMNGFSFSFQLKENKEENVVAFNAASPDYRIEKGPPYVPGRIRFLPFEQTFLQATWEGMLYNTGSLSDTDDFSFAGKRYTYHTFGQLLKPFDLFSDETAAAFLLVPGLEFSVVLLLDHYADWKNSRIVGFDDYCKLVLDTGGLIEARERFLSETDGDELPRFQYKRTRSSVPHLWKKNKPVK